MPKEIRQFYFCVPTKMAERASELTGLPSHAGLISIGDNGRSSLIRRAMVNKDAIRLSLEDQLKIARLGALKAWRMGESLYCNGEWF